MKNAVNQLKKVAGKVLRPRRPVPSALTSPPGLPVELDAEDRRVFAEVVGRQLSMCSHNNLVTTLFACRHVVSAGIRGAFVECGVWRGGNAVLAASVFGRPGQERRVYLFDTFAGMNEPTEHDRRASDNSSAQSKYLETRTDTHTDWCFASLEEVKANFSACAVTTAHVRFVPGPVEVTLADPDIIRPLRDERIAVLRLDTDWYESTKCELETLWPLLSPGGICVIDDYGYWKGAQKAVDEFFSGRTPFLQPIDSMARMMVKP